MATAQTIKRAALIESLQAYALECLQQLEEFKQIEQNYRDATRALKALGVEKAPAKKKAASGKKPANAGKGTGYREPGSTIGDRLDALLTDHPAGLTMHEIAKLLKGVPKNSIVSGFRTLKAHGGRVITERASADSPALRYRLK